MQTVIDRIVQYANRYKLTNAETGQVLGTFDFDEVTGAIQQEGTEINAELFNSIAADIAARAAEIQAEAKTRASEDTDIRADISAETQARQVSDTLLQGNIDAEATTRSQAVNTLTGNLSDEIEARTEAVNTLSQNLATEKSERQAADSVLQNNIEVVDKKADGHIGNKLNPHLVTKEQVGLGNVENERQYSASNPPPYPVTSVAGKTGAVTLGKSDVGLGNVDNTADTDKPVSTAQSTAIADAKKAGTDAQSTAEMHIANKNNPHSVTKEQVLLGNVANERQYSEQNPPPYPVKSVNGKIGEVTITEVEYASNAEKASFDANGTPISLSGIMVGEVKLFAATVNPSETLGGTWEQLTADAYFKIVTTGAGATGGTSSNHTIPIASMPSHDHNFRQNDNTGASGVNDDGQTIQRGYASTNSLFTTIYEWDAQGGGQPYYPYYYGVYAWKRIA